MITIKGLIVFFTLVALCLTGDIRAQMLGHTDNHEIMSISNLRITSEDHLTSKKSYSFQEFIKVVDQEPTKSTIKTNRYFDLSSDEWVTMITTDGFSIHKEAFERGFFGHSSLKSDDYKLVDSEGNVYAVGMSVSFLKQLFPRSFESSVVKTDHVGRHSVVILDGTIQENDIIPFDSYLCFVYNQDTQKVIEILYYQ